MTSRIPKVIPKDGKVWRLTKESWEALRDYDSDPNVAIGKIIALLKQSPTPANPTEAGTCRFDEKKVQKLIGDTVEEVISRFAA
jgi:hypothetical protein